MDKVNSFSLYTFFPVPKEFLMTMRQKWDVEIKEEETRISEKRLEMDIPFKKRIWYVKFENI